MTDARPLRIGVDAREIAGAPTGVGRYLFELLDSWRRRADVDRYRFVLYVPDRPRRGDAGLAPLAGAPSFELREVRGAASTLWEQRHLPRAANRDRLDVFFAPAYSGPLSVTAPLVVVIHDLSYFAHPEWFGWPNGLRRRALTRWSARKAARVLTVSAFSAGEIRRYLDVPAQHVRVVWHGLSPDGRFGADARSRPARERLVLFAGSIFNRRHVPDLVRAFAVVARRHPDARLVIAGENRTRPREEPGALAAALGIAGRVSLPSYVTDAELGDLYSRASVFAFLSEYEGFGLTPLEALASGVPPVVYDTPAAREVYGDAALYVAAGDVEGVASALERLLSDPAARASVLDRAGEVLSRYSWDRAAEQTLSVLIEAARGGPS